MATIGSKPLIAAIAATALLLCACSRSGGQGEMPAPPPSVTVVAAVSEEIKPTITFTGRVQAQDKVELRARIDGFLQKRLFEEGQDVKVGDLLFVIEQEAYKATVAETKANTEKSQAAVTLANLEYDAPPAWSRPRPGRKRVSMMRPPSRPRPAANSPVSRPHSTRPSCS
jgi:membrane fusion protein, multidrug efflux system